MRKVIKEELTNRQKAAVILTVLGPDVSGEVVRHLGEEQIEALTLEVARLERVSPEQRENVILDSFEMAVAQDFIAEGGVDQARSVLEAAFGADKADETMKKIVNAMQVQSFEFLRKADPAQVLSFIQDEHPQTIALILSYMPVNSAAIILSKLASELRGDVASRIAMMEQTPPEVVRRVEQTLEKKVANVLSQEMTQAGGPKALVDLLNRVDRQTERLILEALEDEQPDLADQIKNMMFVFEDIVQLDDRAIQAVLREVDMKELAAALKGVGGAVSDKIYRNMSERAVGMLKEDMEFMGPVRLRVVEEAQQKIVAAIRKLEESGEITVSRSGEDDELV